MSLRIATFNCENLFTRPLAMKDGMGTAGQQAIDHHAELNRIIGNVVYDAADKARLIALDAVYKFSALNTPSNSLMLLNKIRGQLFRRTQAVIEVEDRRASAGGCRAQHRRARAGAEPARADRR